MLRGVEKVGTVVDVNGNPIEAVRVTLGHQQSGILPRSPEDLTDSKGTFRITKMSPQFSVHRGIQKWVCTRTC